MLEKGEFVGSLDCGTTSVRFIVFDKYAQIIAQHQLEFPQYYPNPGWHEHNPLEIQAHAEACIEETVKSLVAKGFTKDSVKVIGITNQRETAFVWSRKTGKPLCNAIVWDDSRTKNLVAHYEHILHNKGLEISPGVWKKGQEAIDALPPVFHYRLYFSATKVRWMIDNYPEVAKAHENDDMCFGTLESWLVYNLVGGVKKGLHVSEMSNAARTLLFNTATLSYDPALLKFFGLRQSIVGDVVSTSQIYGHIAAGSLAVYLSCLTKGEAKCTYGTGGFLVYCTGNEIVKSGHGLLSTVAFQPGPDAKPVFALEGSISSAGSAITWLKDSMHMISSSSQVNDLAAQEPTSGGVYFVTAFSGLLAPYWDSSATGMMIGITQYTNPSHLARATIEATAFQTRAIIQSMNLKVDGGMTNGDLAMSIVADINGTDVIRPEMRESTALGSALLAGSAIGLFGWDLTRPETLSEVNTKGTMIFKPEMSDNIREKRWANWQRAVERCRGWEAGIDEEEEDLLG
ncbi:actin-like ATPase domain-containing protein [Gymnopus androsaceus JB14]|uniref:glycerol kinase n=1 Tax=Gymnopus androsaceus JB14 TaxID=1447944 RepID=A0A6A4HS89_9AGAR|nr:actin-like ATPase domain-containing protein [Gymnopus androsaceus JB14]